MRRFALLCLALLLAAPAGAVGPFGGTVRGFILEEDGRTPRYCATDRGLFRFRNGSWFRDKTAALTQVLDVVETGNQLFALTAAEGVYIRAEDEERWRPAFSGLKGPFGHPVDEVWSIAADPSSARRLYLGSAGKGLFSTANFGRNWRPLWGGLDNLPPPVYAVTAILPPRGKRPLLMGTDGEGLFALGENEKWARTGAGLPAKCGVNILVEDPSDPSHLALAAKAEGLWESRDGGANWKLLRKGAFGVIPTLSIGEDGGVLAYFTDEGIVSANGGKASRPRPPGQLEIARLTARKGGGWLAGLLNDGVAELDTAGNVTGFLNDGLLATSIYSFVPGVEEGSMWCGDGNGVYYSADNGKSWEGRDAGLAYSPVRSLLWHKGTLFAGLYGQGVAAWEEAERRWTVRSAGLGTANTIFSFVEDSAGRLFVGTEGGVLRSTDDGIQWEKASAGLSEGNFWILAVDDKTAGRLWAAGQTGIYSSDDGGGSWTRQIQGEFGQIAVVGGRVLVAMGSRVVEYEDHSIRPLFDGGRDDRVQCLLPAGADLWVGTRQGLWLLRGGSQQLLWGEAPVLALGRASDGRIHAGTDGLGVKTFRVE
jgi:hypothetical protein